MTTLIALWRVGAGQDFTTCPQLQDFTGVSAGLAFEGSQLLQLIYTFPSVCSLLGTVPAEIANATLSERFIAAYDSTGNITSLQSFTVIVDGTSVLIDFQSAVQGSGTVIYMVTLSNGTVIYNGPFESPTLMSTPLTRGRQLNEFDGVGQLLGARRRLLGISLCQASTKICSVAGAITPGLDCESAPLGTGVCRFVSLGPLFQAACVISIARLAVCVTGQFCDAATAVLTGVGNNGLPG